MLYIMHTKLIEGHYVLCQGDLSPRVWMKQVRHDLWVNVAWGDEISNNAAHSLHGACESAAYDSRESFLS